MVTAPQDTARSQSSIPHYKERLQQLMHDAESCDQLRKEESDFMSRLRATALGRQQENFDKAKNDENSTS